jgi:hypothetical protein
MGSGMEIRHTILALLAHKMHWLSNRDGKKYGYWMGISYDKKTKSAWSNAATCLSVGCDPRISTDRLLSRTASESSTRPHFRRRRCLGQRVR